MSQQKPNRRRRLPVLAVFLAVMWAALSATIAWAQVPVKITGSDTLDIHLADDMLIATGQVEITYKGERLQGTEFVYDFARETGSLQDAAGSFSAEKTEGNLYVYGDSISFSPERVELTGGRLTTCDREHPHYYLSASQVEIYPEDRIVFHNVVYWEAGGKLPLFYWPRLIIPLTEASHLELPKVGYSRSTGYFVKNSYAYYALGGRGHLYLDYLQRQGWGYGLRHVYQDSEQGTGSIYLYRLHNRETGGIDWSASWQQEFATGFGLAASLGADYEFYQYSGLPTDDLSVRTTLEWDGENSDFSLQLKQRRVTGGRYLLEQLGELSHKYRLGPGWNWSLAAGWERKDEAGSGEEELSYRGELAHDGSKYDLALRLEQVHNSTEGQAYWQRINRLPELTLTTDAFRPFGLQTELEASCGYYREYPAEVATWRGELGGKLVKLMPVGENLRLNLRGEARAGWYGSGERRLVAKGMANAVYRLNDWTVQVGYSDTEVFGFSPFHFDRETPSETVTAAISRWTDKAGVRVSSGYDFYRRRWQDASARVYLNPTGWLRGSLWTSYDWYDARFETVSGLITLEASPYAQMRMGAIYDGVSRSMRRMDAELSLSWADWELAYRGAYDAVNDEYLLGDLSLTRNMHCRAITLRYNQRSGEVLLEYTVNAFPQTKVKVGSEQDSILFDAEGFEELFSPATGGSDS